MQGFGENCTPRGQCTFGPRLQDDEIKLLAEFVKLQADKDWPNMEATEDKATVSNFSIHLIHTHKYLCLV